MKVYHSRKSDEWSTPQDFYEALDTEFHFNVDAAATAENTKTVHWLRDALAVRWAEHGRSIWLNPPYSKIRAFMNKVLEAQRDGATVVCLVPSRTDTRWWHEYVWDRETHQPRQEVEIRFVKGRLKFGGSTTGAPFPSAVIVFRPLCRF